MPRSTRGYDYDDPGQRPPHGDAEDWEFDDAYLGVWVYYGDDEELKVRWDMEMDLVESWEWNYERPLSYPIPIDAVLMPAQYPRYDKRFERRAQLTIWWVVVVCLVIAVLLVLG